MAVKVLTGTQQAAIATICRHFNISKEMLGVAVGASRRTIERVCEEAVKAKAKTVSVNPALMALEALMYKHKITIPELEVLLEQTPPTIVNLMKKDRATRKSPKAHAGKQVEINMPLQSQPAQSMIPPTPFQPELKLSPAIQALKESLSKKMTNIPFVLLIIDSLIAGIEAKSEIPVTVSELKLIKKLLETTRPLPE